MYFLVRHVFVIWAEISAEVRKVVNIKVAQFLLLNKFALCKNLNFLLHPVGKTQIQVLT